MQAMLDDIGPRLARGTTVISRSLTVRLPEGRIADPLAAIQRAHPAVIIGSYPFFADSGLAGAAGGRTAGTTLIVRGRDADAVDAAERDIEGLALAMGVDAEKGRNPG
jgi:molybdopterin-biosynthesis enzyme MoeA-like protein